MARYLLRVAPIIVAALLCGASPSFCQGFGTAKKQVTLHRKLAATARLEGTSIKVKVTAPGQWSAVAQKLKEVLEADLLHHNNQLRLDDAHPDSLISCTITAVSIPQPATVTLEHPAIKLPIGGSQQLTSVKVSGKLDASYRVETPDRQVIDSDNLEAQYSQTVVSAGGAWPVPFGKKQAVPTTADVEQNLVLNMAERIAARLVNTDDNVTVALARGKLDSANNYAQSGLWDRALEALQTMSPFPKPEDEAYRLYNIGVAYEAMGYAAGEPKAALKFFDEASINYGKALDLNPSEKYFLEPQSRIVIAVDISQRLSQGTSTLAVGAAPGGQTAGLEQALTNADVIKLRKAGMNEANLIDNINRARSVNFDLSTEGQVNLLSNGISNQVLKAMRDRQSPG